MRLIAFIVAALLLVPVSARASAKHHVKIKLLRAMARERNGVVVTPRVQRSPTEKIEALRVSLRKATAEYWRLRGVSVQAERWIDRLERRPFREVDPKELHKLREELVRIKAKLTVLRRAETKAADRVRLFLLRNPGID